VNCRAYYDPKCEELARHFLADAPEHTDAEALELAGAIQQAIEDWWAARHKPVITEWLDPDLPAPSNPVVFPWSKKE
jgi:hypothetical protein